MKIENAWIFITIGIVIVLAIIIIISTLRDIYEKINILALPDYTINNFEINSHNSFVYGIKTFRTKEDLGHEIRIGLIKYTKENITDINQDYYVYVSDDIY